MITRLCFQPRKVLSQTRLILPRPILRARSLTLRRTYSTQAPAQFKLRDYQEDAVNSVLEAIDSGIKRPAVVLATGGGKTVVMSSLIPQIQSQDRLRKKTLVLAHKEELVRQTAKTLRTMNPHLTVDIDMLKQKPGPCADVIIGSVNTLVRLTRLHQYDPSEFKSIVLDECHHAPAQSWTKILNYFGALEPDLEIVVLGLTATLERADGKPLGNFFQKVVYQRELREMIKEKELCDAQFSTMTVDVNLDDVKVRLGDYDPTALAAAVNNVGINSQVAKAYIQLRKELNLKSTLVFCIDVNHCKTLCGVLQAYGVNAQYVTGTTAKHVRQDILEAFKRGAIDVLCNVLVFTEGTDIPNIDSLILARPTKSRPLLTQMVGRGLRLHQGKDLCHVIDMVDTMKVGVLSVPMLFGLPAHHLIDKKSFGDLNKEQEDVSLEAERMEAKAREDDVRRIIGYQEELKEMRLKFEVINGFATMISRRKEDLKEHPERVHEAFRRCGRDWVRLEYDIWGLRLFNTDLFLTMERVPDEFGGVEFTLSKIEPVSYRVLKASNFKCPRRQTFFVNKGSLEYLLLVLGALLGRAPFRARLKKKATSKQVDCLYKALLKRVKTAYGPNRLTEFKNVLTDMSVHRASNLIFALKWSMNSLWISWELKNLLGLSLSLQKKFDKNVLFLESEKAKLRKNDACGIDVSGL